MDQVGNLAAFARIDETGEIHYTTFEAQPVRSCSSSGPCSAPCLTREPSHPQHPSHIRPMMYAGGMGMMGM